MDNVYQDELFLLVGFLLTSACNLYDEPAGYGPFRLVDAAGRLIHFLQARGPSDPFLQELEQAIDRERFGNSNDQQLRAVLDELVLRYTSELKKRV